MHDATRCEPHGQLASRVMAAVGETRFRKSDSELFLPMSRSCYDNACGHRSKRNSSGYANSARDPVVTLAAEILKKISR